MGDQQPDITTMQDAICSANGLLDYALDPSTNGIPRSYLELCRGVILLSAGEVGFVFSGTIGTGVVLARDRQTGWWSPPSAVKIGGVGFGFVAGAGVKDVIIVLMDDLSLNSVAQRGQIKLGTQISLAIGPVGREAEAQIELSKGGAGVAMAWSFSKGLFGAMAMEGAILRSRDEDNARFYGKEDVTPMQILLEPGAVTIPESEAESIFDLHYKLELMQAGKTRDPKEDDTAAKERYRKAANAAGLAAKTNQEESGIASKEEYMAYLQKE